MGDLGTLLAAVVSAFAFTALVWSLRVQQRHLALQAAELQLQRIELRLSRQAQEATVEALELQWQIDHTQLERALRDRQPRFQCAKAAIQPSSMREGEVAIAVHNQPSADGVAYGAEVDVPFRPLTEIPDPWRPAAKHEPNRRPIFVGLQLPEDCGEFVTTLRLNWTDSLQRRWSQEHRLTCSPDGLKHSDPGPLRMETSRSRSVEQAS